MRRTLILGNIYSLSFKFLDVITFLGIKDIPFSIFTLSPKCGAIMDIVWRDLNGHNLLCIIDVDVQFKD